MILVAEIRKVNMKDVLAHPTHWATAMAIGKNADGSLRKTNKAALARELKNNVSCKTHTNSICFHH